MKHFTSYKDSLLNPLDAIVFIAARDWNKSMASGLYGHQDIPSIGALAWAWDFFTQVQKPLPRLSSAYSCRLNALIFEWRNQNKYVLLVVRRGGANTEYPPFIYCRDSEASPKSFSDYSPTPAKLLSRLAQFGFMEATI